jgi:hypothetical protein
MLALVLGEIAMLLVDIENWLALVLAAAATSAVYLALVWAAILREDDKEFVRLAVGGSLRP